jgi:hypothetical protein
LKKHRVIALVLLIGALAVLWAIAGDIKGHL